MKTSIINDINVTHWKWTAFTIHTHICTMQVSWVISNDERKHSNTHTHNVAEQRSQQQQQHQQPKPPEKIHTRTQQITWVLQAKAHFIIIQMCHNFCVIRVVMTFCFVCCLNDIDRLSRTSLKCHILTRLLDHFTELTLYHLLVIFFFLFSIYYYIWCLWHTAKNIVGKSAHAHTPKTHTLSSSRQKKLEPNSSATLFTLDKLSMSPKFTHIQTDRHTISIYQCFISRSSRTTSEK